MLPIITAALLLILLTLLTDPFMLWMPPMAAMAALLGATVLLGAWAGLVMYEKVSDEREREHRMHADRFAYLFGIGILTVALVVQGLSHHIDLWVAAALATMVVAKLGARMYASLYR